MAQTEQFHREQRPADVPIWRETLVGFDWLALRMSPVWYDPATNVEVPGTHLGLAFNPFAYRAIAEHLATAA